MMIRTVSIVVTILTGLFLAEPALRPQASPGPPAPAFKLNPVVGRGMSSDELKGKVVVLDFFATWCPPCLQEIPALSALSKKYKNKNVRVIGIAAESGTIDDVKHKLTEFRVGYRGDPPGPIQLTGILWTAQQI